MTTPIAQRRVFYIPGFDPMPPRRYRELFRTESRKQARISGYQIEQQPGDHSDWSAIGFFDGKRVKADFTVLTWSDIVQRSMRAGVVGTYAQLARTAWIYASNRIISALLRLRKGPVIAALYPAVALLLVFSLALVLFALAATLVEGVLGAALGIVLALGVFWGLKQVDNKLFIFYLMHDYAFAARWYGANPPELNDRLAAFADQIEEALQGDADEVLVVGHSSGAHLAIEVLADLISAGRVPVDAKLSLLTLGQAVPMMSFLPEAKSLRRALQFLSTSEALTWVDVTAPGDGCCFALCDPVAVSGVAPDNQRWPLILSAAFSQTMAPERLKELKWRFFKLHFQYLCAFETPKDYDYFSITVGPLSLSDRFAGRGHSGSRITLATSPHRSIA